MPPLYVFILIGFAAQIVDGALGMAYGVISSTVLLALGIPPAMSSATVHAAEVATTGVSAFSHAAFKNIDKRIFLALAIPGVIGGIFGALVLTRLPGDLIKPYVSLYLAAVGLLIVLRAFREPAVRHEIRHPRFLGFFAGTLDAIGGGGWGSMTTSTLVMRGLEPRYAIGTANSVEFFVSIAIASTLAFSLGTLYWHALAGLLIGGVVAAPLAAYLAKRLPARAMMLLVGSIITVLSLYTVVRAFP